MPTSSLGRSFRRPTAMTNIPIYWPLHEGLNMVACLYETRLDDRALMAQPLFGPAQRERQLPQVAAAQIAQLDALEIVPDALVRVQLGGVAGQLLQVHASGTAPRQEVLDGLAAMNGRPVPDHQELATDLAQQHAQEADDIRRVVGTLLGLQEQAPVRREAADRREMVMSERHAQQRRLPTWCPGPHGQGQPVEARLVYPDDGASFVGRFFSSAGPRCCHQAWMAASLRCAAPATGRCTRCRTACKSPLTCAGWYLQPNVRRMTSATRLQGHTWPRKPYASGPRSTRAGSGATCAALRRGCRPGAGWRRNPSTPCSRPRLSHWLTAPAVTPRAAAMSCCFQPCSFSSQARCRRASRQSSCVILVFMAPTYHRFTPLRNGQ